MMMMMKLKMVVDGDANTITMNMKQFLNNKHKG